MRTLLFCAALAACGDPTSTSETAAPVTSPSTYSLFESGQVRPLARDGNYLYAVNTPTGRLEIFKTGTTLKHVGSVPVGLEPVAVAIHGSQAWVVNHLSDSVSIVDLSPGPGKARVVRTLLVGDEPRDIVFAGPHASRA